MAIASSSITGSSMTHVSTPVRTGANHSSNVNAVSSSHSQDSKTKGHDQTKYVATTEYGDTVQVSENSAKALRSSQDGNVTETRRETDYANQVLGQDSGNDVEENTQIEESLAKAEEPQERKQQELTNLAGYTQSQLRRFYLEGRISLYDYEEEISKHQELLQKTEERQQTTDKIMAELAIMQKTQGFS